MLHLQNKIRFKKQHRPIHRRGGLWGGPGQGKLMEEWAELCQTRDYNQIKLNLIKLNQARLNQIKFNNIGLN